MKFKVYQDNGEIEYMNERRLLGYVKNLKKSNIGDIPRSFNTKTVEDQIQIVLWAGENVEKISEGEYYFQIAREELGSAVRDNTREELIEIGKQIENGDFHQGD